MSVCGYDGAMLFIGQALDGLLIIEPKEWDLESAKIFCRFSRGNAEILDTELNSNFKSKLLDMTKPIVIFPEWKTQRRFVDYISSSFRN